MVDCLEYAVYKENEIPRIIDTVFNMLSNKTGEFGTFNKHMRSAQEIMKDYGLNQEVYYG